MMLQNPRTHLPWSRNASGNVPRTLTPHQWIMLIAALLIALTATASVVTLQRRSDTLRQAEVLVAHIEALANRLKRLELQVESEQQLTPEDAQLAQDIRHQITQALHEVTALDRGRTASQQMQAAFQTYQSTNEELFRLFAAGELAEAEEWDEEHTDPSYDVLFDRTTSASATYRAEAQRSILAANTGSILTMGGAALVIGWLFWRFEQTRRTAAVLAMEQHVLRRSETRFRGLVGNACDVITIIDADGSVRYHSPAAPRTWGYPSPTLHNMSAFAFVHPDDRATAQNLLAQALRDPGVNRATELRFQYADGAWHDVEVIAKNLLDDPSINGVVMTYHDITERRKFEQELTHLTFHDSLTKLPNRALFLVRLESALARAQRHQHSVAVLVFDLDNFKLINDSLGHPVGDELLVAVAARLQNAVRPMDTIARLGGDEFTILLEDLVDVTQAIQIAERIGENLQAPIGIGGHEVFTGVSIGIALSMDGQDRPSDLLRDADLAMYRAKTNGKGRYALFDRTLTDHALKRMAMETDLRHALERDELRVYYQPVVNLETNIVTEVEALLRWQHPQRGLVAPTAFIPVAEETGLILAIGEWVLAHACRQAVAWQRQYPKNAPLVMGVNLSPRQFQDAKLVQRIQRILQESGLEPRYLKLEITESMMMQDSATTIAILQELKRLGVQLAIDDFGTGYCSLNYLKRFPVDTLKIDRSFVNGLGHNPEDTAIVRAVLAFAKALNLSVTGEGVETADQVAQLTDLQCERGQGYYFSTPHAAEAISAFLAGTASWETQARPTTPQEVPA